MASVKVQIAPELLQWVLIQTSGMQLSEKNLAHLQSWADGTKEPTFAQIEQVSKGTGIPLGYFFLKKPPQEDLSLVEYRTVDSLELNQPSRNLIDTLYNMEQIQFWLRDHAISEGCQPLKYVGALEKDLPVADFAREMRDILRLDENWHERVHSTDQAFRYLREKISDAGVTVMMNGIVGNNTKRTLSVNEFRAFALIDEYAPLIFINTKDSIGGRVFSLLHEFAHVCFGENSLFNRKESAISNVNATETLCNAAAAEILVPQQVFCEKWENVHEDNWKQMINTFAKYFCCSTTVIARKALDCGYIDQKQYAEIAREAKEAYQTKKKGSGGNYYKTAASRIDHRFLKTLSDGVQSGRTSPTEAYRLTNTNRSTFSELVKTVLEG